jgi:DNA modification methylase
MHRVELAPCISDGGLQHHAVAELQHIGEDPLLDITDCGDIVVDPFLGSGSTLIAADAAASSSIRSTSM